MLERNGGGFEWSSKYNSRFAPSKFALIDFSMNRTKEHLPMIIRGATITPSPSHNSLESYSTKNSTGVNTPHMPQQKAPATPCYSDAYPNQHKESQQSSSASYTKQ